MYIVSQSADPNPFRGTAGSKQSMGATVQPLGTVQKKSYISDMSAMAFRPVR